MICTYKLFPLSVSLQDIRLESCFLIKKNSHTHLTHINGQLSRKNVKQGVMFLNVSLLHFLILNFMVGNLE